MTTFCGLPRTRSIPEKWVTQLIVSSMGHPTNATPLDDLSPNLLFSALCFFPRIILPWLHLGRTTGFLLIHALISGKPFLHLGVSRHIWSNGPGLFPSLLGLQREKCFPWGFTPPLTGGNPHVCKRACKEEDTQTEVKGLHERDENSTEVNLGNRFGCTPPSLIHGYPDVFWVPKYPRKQYLVQTVALHVVSFPTDS